MKTILPYLIPALGLLGGIAADWKAYKKSCEASELAKQPIPDYDISMLCTHLAMWLAPFGALGAAVSTLPG